MFWLYFVILIIEINSISSQKRDLVLLVDGNNHEIPRTGGTFFFNGKRVNLVPLNNVPPGSQAHVVRSGKLAADGQSLEFISNDANTRNFNRLGSKDRTFSVILSRQAGTTQTIPFNVNGKRLSPRNAVQFQSPTAPIFSSGGLPSPHKIREPTSNSMRPQGHRISVEAKDESLLNIPTEQLISSIDELDFSQFLLGSGGQSAFLEQAFAEEDTVKDEGKEKRFSWELDEEVPEFKQSVHQSWPKTDTNIDRTVSQERNLLENSNSQARGTIGYEPEGSPVPEHFLKLHGEPVRIENSYETPNWGRPRDSISFSYNTKNAEKHQSSDYYSNSDPINGHPESNRGADYQNPVVIPESDFDYPVPIPLSVYQGPVAIPEADASANIPYTSNQRQTQLPNSAYDQAVPIPDTIKYESPVPIPLYQSQYKSSEQIFNKFEPLDSTIGIGSSEKSSERDPVSTTEKEVNSSIEHVSAEYIPGVHLEGPGQSSNPTITIIKLAPQENLEKTSQLIKEKEELQKKIDQLMNEREKNSYRITTSEMEKSPDPPKFTIIRFPSTEEKDVQTQIESQRSLYEQQMQDFKQEKEKELAVKERELSLLKQKISQHVQRNLQEQQRQLEDKERELTLRTTAIKTKEKVKSSDLPKYTIIRLPSGVEERVKTQIDNQRASYEQQLQHLKEEKEKQLAMKDRELNFLKQKISHEKQKNIQRQKKQLEDREKKILLRQLKSSEDSLEQRLSRRLFSGASSADVNINNSIKQKPSEKRTNKSSPPSINIPKIPVHKKEDDLLQTYSERYYTPPPAPPPSTYQKETPVYPAPEINYQVPFFDTSMIYNYGGYQTGFPTIPWFSTPLFPGPQAPIYFLPEIQHALTAPAPTPTKSESYELNSYDPPPATASYSYSYLPKTPKKQEEKLSLDETLYITETAQNIITPLWSFTDPYPFLPPPILNAFTPVLHDIRTVPAQAPAPPPETPVKQVPWVEGPTQLKSVLEEGANPRVIRMSSLAEAERLTIHHNPATWEVKFADHPPDSFLLPDTQLVETNPLDADALSTLKEPKVECLDENKHCSFWAYTNECNGQHAGFMRGTCRSSCDMCETDRTSSLINTNDTFKSA